MSSYFMKFDIFKFDDYDLIRQHSKVFEEVCEVTNELVIENYGKINSQLALQEILDVFQASSTLINVALETFGLQEFEKAFDAHKEKMYKRKYKKCGNIEMKIKL